MTMPTSKATSAGASLMPSPASATRRPCLRRSSTFVCSWVGRTSANTSSMPTALANRPHEIADDHQPSRYGVRILAEITSSKPDIPLTYQSDAYERWRSGSPSDSKAYQVDFLIFYQADSCASPHISPRDAKKHAYFSPFWIMAAFDPLRPLRVARIVLSAACHVTLPVGSLA